MARSTIRLAQLGSIAIEVHFTLLVALPLFGVLVAERMAHVVAVANLMTEAGAYTSPLGWGVLLTVGLVLSVLLHEAAHAAVASAFGQRVSAIVLVLLGGHTAVAPVTRPGRRALIALAGPALSLGLGVLLFAAAMALPLAHLDVRMALLTLGEVQLVLGVVDLLPAPPLDGGRIVAAALEPLLGRTRAVDASARVGKGLAVIVAVVGTLSARALLIAAAAVLWAGAERSARGVHSDALLRGITVADVLARAVWVESGASVAALADRMRSERSAVFLVHDAGRCAGVVALDDVRGVPVEARCETRVADVRREAPAVELHHSGHHALAVLQTARLRALPAVCEGRVVGMVTAEGLRAAGEIGTLDAVS